MVFFAKNQSELAFTKVERKRYSLLDMSQFNGQMPEDLTKGRPNVGKFRKDGITNKFYMKADYAFGALSQSLKAFAVNAYYKYDSKSAEKIDNYTLAPRENAHSIGAGVTIDGLAYRLPIAFDVTYDKPIGGDHSKSANEVLAMSLKLYARF